MLIIIMTLLLCYCIISYLVCERICWYFSSASEVARVRCLQREGEREGGEGERGEGERERGGGGRGGGGGGGGEGERGGGREGEGEVGI